MKMELDITTDTSCLFVSEDAGKAAEGMIASHLPLLTIMIIWIHSFREVSFSPVQTSLIVDPQTPQKHPNKKATTKKPKQNQINKQCL